MTKEQKETLWFMINDQMEGIDRDDAEFVAEQWWAEVNEEVSINDDRSKK